MANGHRSETKTGKDLLLEVLGKENGVGAFYIYGDNEKEKAELEKTLADASLADGVHESNYLVVADVRKVRAEKLSAMLKHTPMFAERRIMVIHCAEKMDRDQRRELNLYLAHCVHDCLLLVLVNSPHTRRDETLTSDKRFVLVECK
ncbi:hypothetical protein KW800_02230 [Candidatus Parcubacteria bacterium]|nr:hypothetical protein [Candidatus Parcubacteria bacterium]